MTAAIKDNNDIIATNEKQMAKNNNIINLIKDSDEYNICKMFYVEKQSDQYIATKLNYSKSSIEKKKHNIVAKLKKS